MPDNNTITGKVIAILPVQSGTSKAGKEWSKQDFIVETGGQYPSKVCFTRWGQAVEAKKGDEVTVSFDAESREYNERWYTDLKAWKIDGGSGAGVTAETVANVLDAETDADGTPLPF